jgi:hypothetical protein
LAQRRPRVDPRPPCRRRHCGCHHRHGDKPHLGRQDPLAAAEAHRHRCVLAQVCPAAARTEDTAYSRRRPPPHSGGRARCGVLTGVHPPDLGDRRPPRLLPRPDGVLPWRRRGGDPVDALRAVQGDCQASIPRRLRGLQGRRIRGADGRGGGGQAGGDDPYLSSRGARRGRRPG